MQAASVSTDANGDLMVVLRGDIDFTSSPGVLQVVRAQATTEPAAGIRVDLADVTFMDSSGIGVLVQLLHLAEQRRVTLRLERVGSKVQDQLRMSGLSELFGLAPSSGWLTAPAEDHS